jgi:hypothetical protein
MQRLSFFVCTVLAFILLWAALSKISDLNAFYEALLASGFSPRFSFLVTFAIPSLELTLGGLLFFPGAERPARLCTAALMTLFLVWQILDGLHPPEAAPPGCPCFKLAASQIDPLTQPMRVARGVLFCVMAYFLVYVDKRFSGRTDQPSA